MTVEAMCLKQASRSLPDGPWEKRAVTRLPRDTSEAQMCDTFVSPRTTRSLCVRPLNLVLDAFSDRAVQKQVRNDRLCRPIRDALRLRSKFSS
jgi:hypothetical protein